MVKKTEIAPDSLRQAMDRFYSKYCTHMRYKPDAKTKIALSDTEMNRLLIAEFVDNYLSQRAASEGWTYKRDNIKVYFCLGADIKPTKLYDPCIPVATDPKGFEYASVPGIEFLSDNEVRVLSIRESEERRRILEDMLRTKTDENEQQT